MFQTSYFASKAPASRKVSIAKYPPRGWHGPRAPLLAPTDPKAENWREAYLFDLKYRFPQGVGLKEYLERIARNTPEPVLCCYEADPCQCHRRILAEYVKTHLGLEMPEWVGDTGQMSLF